MSNALKGMVAGVGVAAVGGFLKGAISAASDLNEVASKSRNVFGASADAMEQWAEGGAESFGLSKRAALEAAGGFGNMFAQLGVGQQQAAGMSRSIVELAADFASFHNASIEDVLVAQSAAFRGEYDSVQRFLPLLNAASVEQRALAMTSKRTTKELTAQDKALAVNTLMFEGAGDAVGDFDRTADSLANRLRSMEGQWENTRAALGESLLPLMTELGGVMQTAVIPAFTDLFTSAGSATSFAAQIQDALSDVGGFFIGAIQLWARTIAGFVDDLPFGWGDDFANELRTGADALDPLREKLHASKEELQGLAGAGDDANAMLSDISNYLKASTGSLGAHTGALALDSKAIMERDKATRDAAKAERDLGDAQRTLTQLLADGAVDEEKVTDARQALADATKDAARADRDLADAQKEYDEALANANDLSGWDTAQEALADAGENLADAQESSADAHRRAKEAADDLREAQAGDPDFQNKLADARDRVADAQDKINTSMAKLVEMNPAVNTALDETYKRLDAIGIRGVAVGATLATITGYESYQNMLEPANKSPVIPPAAPAGLLGSAVLSGTSGAGGAPVINQTFNTHVEPKHVAREMIWALD
jgi:tetratricopeptide (TPR) repeat protein